MIISLIPYYETWLLQETSCNENAQTRLSGILIAGIQNITDYLIEPAAASQRETNHK